MYDPKFEKAMQQRMDELEFRPTESVWVNIEKAVVAGHRRRGAGFFWQLLLPGVLLVAAAGIYFYHGNSKGKTAEDTITRAGAVRPATIRAITQPALQNISGVAGKNSKRDRNGAADQTTRRTLIDAPANTPGITPRPTATYTPGNTPVNTPDYSPQDAAVTSQTPVMSPLKAPAPSGQLYLPGLVDQRLSPQIDGTALKTQKNSISLVGLSQKKYHWEAGFAGSGGSSRLNRLNANQAQAAVTRMAASLYNINGSPSSKHYISETRPGASFDGGIYLQRALSSRWILNTGMSLHYYSNTISIGQQLTTYVNASASYLTPTVPAMSQNTTMYASGNQQSYTNRYYFLELPAAVQWKLSNNRILPVFLEGGVSLSRLMGADALFYNAKTGLYSKDGDVVNKTQFNVSSALLVGLPFHGVRIQLGPQVQYGLTPLVHTSGLGDQHFFYAGLRFVIIPGKW